MQRKGAKRDALLSHGAQHLIATEEQELIEQVCGITVGKGARIVFDPVAGEGVQTLAEAALLAGPSSPGSKERNWRERLPPAARRQVVCGRL